MAKRAVPSFCKAAIGSALPSEREFYMSTPDFHALCALWGLGELTAPPVSLTGGLLHKMFRLETEGGVFAAKALNPGILRRPEAMGNYLRSEEIARSAAAAGFPALPALTLSGEPLVRTGEQYWMLFPWAEGRALRGDDIRPEHCARMGALLQQLHGLFPAEERAPAAQPIPSGCWTELLNEGADQPWAEPLRQLLPSLRIWTEQGSEAPSALEQGQVLSHRDMDPKNVLWTRTEAGDQPLVIDWEAAGRVHPLQERLETALCWSDDGRQTCCFDAFMGGYGPLPPDASRLAEQAAAAVVLGRLDWLRYNLLRSLGGEGADEEARQLGCSEALQVLRSLPSLVRLLKL